MPTPLDIQYAGSGTDVAAIDRAGNATFAGAVTTGKYAALQAQGAAPTAIPGTLLLYTTDGITLRTVAAGGQSGGQAVPGNLSVGGNLTVAGTSTLTGAVTAGAGVAVTGRITDTSADINGALTITQTVPTTNNPGTISISESAAANSSYASYVTGDTVPRYAVSAAGTVRWSAGSGSQDIAMSRSAAGILSLTAGILDPQAGTKTTAAAASITPTFADAVASQLADVTRDYMVYLQIGTAGTGFSVLIGPTATPAHTLYASATPPAGALISFRLPAGWFVEWAGTGSTLANQLAVGC